MGFIAIRKSYFADFQHFLSPRSSAGVLKAAAIVNVECWDLIYFFGLDRFGFDLFSRKVLIRRIQFPLNPHTPPPGGQTP